MNEDMTKACSVKQPQDLLAMTLGELLQLLAASRPDVDRWIEVKNCEIPYREALAAVKCGELQGSRVGRKLLVRRSELDRWIESRHIAPPKQAPSRIAAPSPVAHILEAAGYRKAGVR